MASVHEAMGTFVWYAVEFMANIAVIVYVAAKLGYIRTPSLVKSDVPATIAEQVKDTASMIRTFGEVLGSMKGMLPTVTPAK